MCENVSQPMVVRITGFVQRRVILSNSNFLLSNFSIASEVLGSSIARVEEYNDFRGFEIPYVLQRPDGGFPVGFELTGYVSQPGGFFNIMEYDFREQDVQLAATDLLETILPFTFTEREYDPPEGEEAHVNHQEGETNMLTMAFLATDIMSGDLTILIDMELSDPQFEDNVEYTTRNFPTFKAECSFNEESSLQDMVGQMQSIWVEYQTFINDIIVKAHDGEGYDNSLFFIDSNVPVDRLVITFSGFKEVTDSFIGCYGYKRGSVFAGNLLRGDKLTDPISTDNNCLYACIYLRFKEHILEMLQETENSNIDIFRITQKMRIASGIRHNRPLNYEEVAKVEDWLGFIRIILYEEKISESGRYYSFEQSYVGSNMSGTVISLIIYKNHCGLIENMSVLKFVRCYACSQWVANVSHTDTCRKCTYCHKKISQKQIHKCRNLPKRKEYDDSLKRNKFLSTTYNCSKAVYLADFETVPVKGKMIVFSAAIVNLKKLMHFVERDEVENAEKQVECAGFYGKNCLFLFVKYILRLKGTLIFYNGSRFDFYFVFKQITSMGVKISKMIEDDKSKKLISFQVKGLRLWDLCLFTQCSLDSLCKSLNLQEKWYKRDFDHDKLCNWKAVEEHKDQVIYYNTYDVISLGICYDVFARRCFSEYKLNIKECLTLSNYAFEVWRNIYLTKSERLDIKIPNEEKYKFLRRGLYGGRTACQRAAYQSKDYQKIFHNLDDHIRVPKETFEEISDYCLLFDVVSLYPAACVQGQFPMGNANFLVNQNSKYINMFEKAGRGTISEREKLLIQTCVFEVDVQCPNNIMTPFLFARIDGSLHADLHDKSNQVYDGFTLLHAVGRLGYKVCKIHKILQYERLGQPIKKFMEEAFDQKAKAKRDKDNVAYMVYKLLMNSLTGKFSQRWIEYDYHVVYEDRKIKQWLLEKRLEKLTWISGDKPKSIIAAVCKVLKAKTKPSKPLQLGVFLLAHSRIIMSEYLLKFDGYLTPDLSFHYQDTDSYVIHRDAFILANIDMTEDFEDIFGTSLGKLDDELEGGKIVRAFYWAPKTYVIEYLTAPQPYSDGFSYSNLMWKVRSKGIPCPRRDKINALQYMCEEDGNWVRRRNKLKDIVFLRYTPEGVLVDNHSVLTPDLFEDMFEEKSIIVVEYGAMKRYLHAPKSNNEAARVMFLSKLTRTINKTNWWKSGIRSSPGQDIYSITYPKGHHLY